MRKRNVGILLLLVIGFILVFWIFFYEEEKIMIGKEVNYNGNNLMISIDGEVSSTLPTSGDYYLANYSCKSSNTILEWDKTNYQLKVTNKGKKAGVACNLEFETYPKLADMEAGSYVSYTGNNGCSGVACQGQNANYVSDTDMGYCNDSSKKYIVNGWRLGYIKNNTAYLISAGAPECVRTYADSRATNVSTVTLSAAYYYGSGYDFDTETGTFSLTGVTSSTLSWSSSYTSIINNTPYTCMSTSSTGTCSSLYEISSYYSSTQGYVYYHQNYDQGDMLVHIANLDNKALSYCNKSYTYSGLCNSSNSWAIDSTDLENIIDKSFDVCVGSVAMQACGYNNDIIDNGGRYWVAESPFSSSSYAFNWNLGSFYENLATYVQVGLRPVLRLDSNVVVTGGSGTYEEPYTIGNNTFWINDGATTVSSANKGSVNLTLMTVDATQMCISTNTSVCTNYVDFNTSYTLDWSSEEAGEKIVYVYYKNSSGRITAAINRSITLEA